MGLELGTIIVQIMQFPLDLGTNIGTLKHNLHGYHISKSQPHPQCIHVTKSIHRAKQSSHAFSSPSLEVESPIRFSAGFLRVATSNAAKFGTAMAMFKRAALKMCSAGGIHTAKLVFSVSRVMKNMKPLALI